MGAAASFDLLPPASSSGSVSKTGERLFSLLLLVLAFAFVWLCRVYGPESVHRWFAPMPFQEPVDLLLLFGAVLTAMLLHESGHLLASLGLGFEFLGASLGPLNVQTLHGTWKLSFSRRTLFNGSVSAVPRSLNHWRTAMMIVVAAGPFATLGTAFGIASLPADNDAFSLFQIAFVQVSVLLFVLGLIPSGPHSRVRNDARLFLDLALRNQGAEEMELNVMLSQQVIEGIRPQDYPETMIGRLAAWRGRPESQLAFAQVLVRWALDSEEIELADAWDLRALALAEEYGTRMQNAVLASSACFDVVFREDLKSARNKFARVDFDVLFPKCFEQRARASHQVALGRLHRASPHIIRAQYAIPRRIPAYALERSLIAKLHMKVLHASTPAHGTKAKSASAY